MGLLVARVRPRDERAGVLVGSLAIDLDHAPSELGHEWLRTGGRGRPYPHTIFTVVAALPLSRAVALGLAAHLARDLTDATTGVKLLWPLSRRELQLPPALYPLAVGALAAGAAQDH